MTSGAFRDRVPVIDQVKRWRTFVEMVTRAALACESGDEAAEREAIFHLGAARRRASFIRFPHRPAHAQKMAGALMSLTEGWSEVMPDDRLRLVPSVRELAKWCDGALNGEAIEAAIENRERMGLD